MSEASRGAGIFPFASEPQRTRSSPVCLKLKGSGADVVAAASLESKPSRSLENEGRLSSDDRLLLLLLHIEHAKLKPLE